MIFQKLKNWFNSLLIVEDDRPQDGYGRRWKYSPTAGVWKGSVYVGVNLNMIQWHGEPCEPHPCQMAYFHFMYDPRKWTFKQVHIWYDGENCIINLGIFAISQHCMWNCKKCCQEI